MHKHPLRQLRKIWTESWTELWGKIKIAAGTASLALPYVGKIIHSDDVQHAIQQWNPPVYVAIGLAILGAITLLSMEHKSE